MHQLTATLQVLSRSDHPHESLSAIGLNSELKADNVAYDGQPVGYNKTIFVDPASLNQ